MVRTAKIILILSCHRMDSTFCFYLSKTALPMTRYSLYYNLICIYAIELPAPLIMFIGSL
uniref:Uncharacterized protein n=1 Tax=Octopus bimaculoides TaxID=37653 RepID=A0A0L8GAL1_OCTBM